MFKKAKRANLRRRNESDEDEQEEGQQPLLAPTLCGPVVEEIPFMESSNSLAGVRSTADIHHGNGLQANSVKAVKKGKSKDLVASALGGPKASLLSFDDDEGS